MTRNLCASCEATPAGCHALTELAGRRCCTRCDGSHAATSVKSDFFPTQGQAETPGRAKCTPPSVGSVAVRAPRGRSEGGRRA